MALTMKDLDSSRGRAYTMDFNESKRLLPSRSMIFSRDM